MSFITAKEMRRSQRGGGREGQIRARLAGAARAEFTPKPKHIEFQTIGSRLAKKTLKQLDTDGYAVKVQFVRYKCSQYGNMLKVWRYKISW